MTVSELIAWLQTMPAYAPVMVTGIDDETLFDVNPKLYGTPLRTGDEGLEFIVMEVNHG